jgi:hypothetical protein
MLLHLRTTIRPGNIVLLVNVGAGGALVHSVRPLRPGSRIHVHIAAGEKTRHLVAVVQRCGVAVIGGANGVTYAGALAFDNACDLPWESRTRPG